MKIIVVDDSGILRQRIIEMILTIPETEILAEASSSKEAIKLLKELKPDAMILDIRMPLGSGIEVLKEMSQLDYSLLTIVLTNYPLEQYKEMCLGLGADYFFDKVNEFEKVKEVISNHMELKA